LYAGSRKSEVYVRLYEKGRKDDPSRPDWVRFEVEVKPAGRARREWLAGAGPLEAMGLSRWVRAFVAEQFDLAVPAAPVRVERLGDDERALNVVALQYGRVLGRLAAREGSWEALGVLLRDRAAEFGRAAR
jgi:hypothetical protein